MAISCNLSNLLGCKLASWFEAWHERKVTSELDMMSDLDKL